MLTRCLAVALLLASCATAREVPPDSDTQRGSDAAASPDGPADALVVPPDSPVSSGTCTQPFSGVLATWSFTSAAGNQASTAASMTAPGIIAGDISRTGVTAVSGLNSINASNWPLAAQLDAAKYYTLSITPPAGCTLTLTSADIDGKSSNTGPASAAIAASTDSFAATTPVSTTAASTPALSVTAASSDVELRIYGYAATSASGTFRLQNTLSVSGSIQ